MRLEAAQSRPPRPPGLAAAILALFLVVTPAGPQSTAFELIQRGDSLMAARDTRAAIAETVALARRAVRRGPRISRAHTTLAATLGLYGRLIVRKHGIARAGEVITVTREVQREARRATVRGTWRDP